jgi:SAM-dependent methyltransferase
VTIVSFYSDFAEYYEAVFPWRPVVQTFLESHLPATQQRILDIGCGTGHYCGRLAAAGHRVVGIDLDPEMITTARREYPQATFECLDMIDVDALDASFDMIYCIGNVAAHLPSDQLPRFLAKLAALLTSGGCWLFQVVNWDFILTRSSHCFPDKPVGEEGVVFQREYQDISPAGLRFRTRLATPDREIFSGEVRLYPVPAADYLRRHADAGFVLAGHFADFQRKPFTPDRPGASVYVFQAGS